MSGLKRSEVHALPFERSSHGLLASGRATGAPGLADGSKFRPVVDDDTEAKLFRTLRAPSRAARKRRQVASPAGTGEGGGATPCVAAALAVFSRHASGTPHPALRATLPRERERVGLCAWRAWGRQAVGHVEHGLDQSFSGFGTVGNPAATPETPSPCGTITPASSATCAAVLPEAYCAGGEACAR